MSITLGNTTLWATTYEIAVDGRRYPMQPQKFEILSRLAQTANIVVKHKDLLDTAWGDRADGPDDHIVKVQVCHLRKILKAIGSDWTIRSVFGVGYILESAGEPNIFETYTPRQHAALIRAIKIAEKHDPRLVAILRGAS